MVLRAAQFGYLGYSPNTEWLSVPRVVLVDGYRTVLWNVEGVIFYLDSTELAKELAVGYALTHIKDLQNAFIWAQKVFGEGGRYGNGLLRAGQRIRALTSVGIGAHETGDLSTPPPTAFGGIPI